MKKNPLIWTVLIGLALLALAATAALADSPRPVSEVEAPVVQPSQLNAVIGDDPDEDGYQGPIELQSLPLTHATEAEPAEAVDWETVIGGAPQPDQDAYYDAASAPDDWSSFYYFFAPGSVFRPRDSDTTWNYDSAGCISVPSGNQWFTLHLDLHEGARIDYLRLFYYDTNATYNSTALIVNYDGQANFNEYALVESIGSSGYGTSLSGFADHVVDNSARGYAVLWLPGANGSSLRLCGVRVAYRLPTPG